MVHSVEQFFSELSTKIDASKTEGMNASFQFCIEEEEGGHWYVKVVDGQPTVGSGVLDDPDITITTSASTWLEIVNGTLSGQAAFLTGKLMVQGDMGLALKLQAFFT
jgi:putative sterol carrier protein